MPVSPQALFLHTYEPTFRMDREEILREEGDFPGLRNLVDSMTDEQLHRLQFMNPNLRTPLQNAVVTAGQIAELKRVCAQAVDDY